MRYLGGVVDYGKKFEERFKLDWINTFPNGTITRLYDVTTGYKSMSTICDFICYNYPYQFFIECKAHKGASLPFTVLTQYDKMIKELNKPGVQVGVMLWLYEKDKVLYIPISIIQCLKQHGEKSVGLRHLTGQYNIIDIPAKKLIHFMKCDFSCLMNL